MPKQSGNRKIYNSVNQREQRQINESLTQTEATFDGLSHRYSIAVALAVFLVFQVAISSGSYSGHNKPPLFGDFEAQRHWMELTVHLPTHQWYINSTDNDLNYWGLDYPPLTAYHSWALGKISSYLNYDWVALHTSRGIETQEHKLFMRLSVIFTMLLLYAPALIITSRHNLTRLISMICYPALLFIDNGHFQYNHIALGLFLWSVHHFQLKRYSIGSILFVLALNFKQMELYHALPVFVFLLSRSIDRSGGSLLTTITRLIKLAFIVLLTFTILWLPFLSSTSQVLHRLFPFDRGVFEDNVASWWCALNVVIKIKQLYEPAQLAKAAAILVLASIMPSLFILLRRPSNKNFRLALVISALSFFLFSFQVHEKSILLATVPALLLFDDLPTHCINWVLSASMISLYPLCVKDGMPEILPLFIAYTLFLHLMADSRAKHNNHIQLLLYVNGLIALILCCLLLWVDPPSRYPHLFELFFAVFGFIHFVLFWLYANVKLVQFNWDIYRIKKS